MAKTFCKELVLKGPVPWVSGKGTRGITACGGLHVVLYQKSVQTVCSHN